LPSDEEPLAERAYPILLEGHSDSVVSAEFSPDGTRVVTASDDRTAIIWDVLTGVPIAVLRGHSGSLTSAHFDDTGARVVTTSLDGTARVWDAASAEQLAIFLGHQDFVNDARFDSSGRRVVTASEDGTARLWDSQTGDLLAVLSGHGGPVTSAIFNPNGSQVATANDHSTIGIWDAVDGSELFVLPESILEGQYTNLAVRAIVFSPDGSRLVAAGDDGHVNVWDTQTGANMLNINAHGRGITWADLSPDGNRIVSASFFAGVTSIWNAADGSELITINHGGIINDVAFSTDGTSVATAVGSDVRVWNAVSGEILVVLKGHTGTIRTVEFSPNGEELVTASADGTARIWNVSVAAQEAEQDAATGLSLEGLWLVMAGTDGLWAVNADGTGATRISDYGFNDVTSPAGQRHAEATWPISLRKIRTTTLRFTSSPCQTHRMKLSLH
jgi:WD40 repeat protein